MGERLGMICEGVLAFGVVVFFGATFIGFGFVLAGFGFLLSLLIGAGITIALVGVVAGLVKLFWPKNTPC